MTRIWDSYLTAQDHEHLSVSRSAPVPLDYRGAKFGLILIDNYEAALGEDALSLLESVRRWPASTGEAGWAAVRRIEVLLQAARDYELPIAHVTGLPQEESGIPGWRAFGRTGRRDGEVNRDPHRYDLVRSLRPAPGEAVVKKAAPSAFFGTLLVSYLLGCGVTTVVVCGQTTSGCVRASVVDAVSYRFRVLVAEDGVYDRTEASHAINLFDMNQKYADVRPVAEIVELLATAHAGSGE